MYKTLRLSFSLKNTYRVNTILYSLKQIPLLKKLLPAKLYQVKGLKVLANVLAAIWELISIFGGKALYFCFMVYGFQYMYGRAPENDVFLHIFLLLTLIGTFMNTSMFNPTRDKYYAMILMRMNARSYTLVNYGCAMISVILGFLPFSIIFGRNHNVPLWFCLLIPFCVAGAKLCASAYSLWNYEKKRHVYNENRMQWKLWVLAVILLALAYGLPAFGIVLPLSCSMAVMLAFIPAGVIGVRKIVAFPHYRQINQELLADVVTQMDAVTNVAKTNSRNAISADITITSDRSGFEYLNELFIKRHKKILWKSTVIISMACAVVFGGVLGLLYFMPEIKPEFNELILNWLPYFTFIMYLLNRGTGFTQALFMNCDHSLLTYSFYKQPNFVLKLFRIRLREIVKINAVPALVIAAGLSLLLFVSGGTDNPFNYLVLFVSILCMSMFFSIHYLTIYYLLQPYNAGTEIKSGTYKLIMGATYMLCWAMMQIRMPLMIFGAACIAFCVLYSVVASVLVYRFAPKTFRIRT